MSEANDAFDSNGAADDAAALAIVSKAAAQAGKVVETPEGAKTPEQKQEAEEAAALAAAEAAKKAAEAAEAQKKQEEEARKQIKEAQDSGVRYEYNETGDVGLDMALAFVGNLGFSAESTAIQSAQKGDFAPLKAALEVLGDKAKGWEKYMTLAEQALTKRQEAAKAKADADEQAVYTAVGGKEAWDAIAEHARQNADEGEKKAIQAAMAAGGMQAQGMAVLLKQAYDRAHPKTPAMVKKEASGGSGGGSGEKMTPAQYAAEVRKIASATRGPIDNNPKYLALREQYARQ